MTTQACSSNRKLKFESPVFFYICSVTEELTEVQYYPPPTEYNVPDLVKHWVSGEPSFEYEYEWLDYHTSLSWVESEYFHSLAAGNLIDSVERVNYLVSLHANTTLLAVATIERLMHHHHTPGNYSESIRYQALIEYLKSFLKPNSPQRSLPPLKWTRKFSDFCEVFNTLYDTGCIKGTSKIDSFRLLKEFIQFDSEKSEANFHSTSSANLRRNLPIQFWTELENEYEDIILRQLEN